MKFATNLVFFKDEIWFIGWFSGQLDLFQSLSFKNLFFQFPTKKRNKKGFGQHGSYEMLDGRS